MTTDLTGDFELGEDEFDWDVFLPDPDEAEMETEASALETEAELSLDDSDFDWDRALRDDAGPTGEADDERAGAAYDRIVDTVRRSVEDEPPTDADSPTGADFSTDTDSQHEADTIPALGLVDDPELQRDTEGEPIVAAFTTYLADAKESEADADHVAGWLPAEQVEPRNEPGSAIDHEPHATWMAEPRPETESESEREPGAVFVREPDLAAGPQGDLQGEVQLEPEGDQWLPLDEDPLLAGTDPEPTVAVESAQTTEPEPPHLAGAAAAVAAIGTEEPAPLPSTDDNATWAMAPAEPWEVDDPADSLPDARTAGTREDGDEKPKRSLVFTATVVLAVLILVAVVAVVAVRALHHPTTTAAPSAQVTTPTQAAGTSAPGRSSTGTAASGTARIQAATDAVDSATTAASVGLTSLSAFPTPTNVETVINPYVSSLQLYETFLSGTKVPPSAQPAAASAVARIRQDLQFLETIDGLPPAQLGAFLVQFDTDATQLQTTLSTLEQDLRTPAS
jgi:hypothetical protein